MNSLYLTDEETVLLDGKCSAKVQLVDGAKARLASRNSDFARCAILSYMTKYLLTDGVSEHAERLVLKMEDGHESSSWSEDALRSQILALLPKCEWTEDDDGSYDTACGEKHLFIEGDARANDYKFCPYCGSGIDSQAKNE